MNSKEKGDRKPIKALRTYQGDIDELMTEKKYSATSVLVAEQKRREERPDLAKVAGRNEARNKTFLLVGGLLLVFGILAVGAGYYISSNQKVIVEQKTKSIIAFTVEKKIFDTTRDSLANTIVSETNSFSLPLNSVLFLNPMISETKEMSTEKFIELLAPKIPPALERSFGKKYMLGILSYDTNEPFIIIKVDDFALSYSGMLSWEKDMISDLGKIFKIDSATPSVFVDEAIRNKDLRIVKNSNGEVVLLYSFMDRETLVITKNESVFNAILAKYLTNQNIR